MNDRGLRFSAALTLAGEVTDLTLEALTAQLEAFGRSAPAILDTWCSADPAEGEISIYVDIVATDTGRAAINTYVFVRSVVDAFGAEISRAVERASITVTAGADMPAT